MSLCVYVWTALRHILSRANQVRVNLVCGGNGILCRVLPPPALAAVPSGTVQCHLSRANVASVYMQYGLCLCPILVCVRVCTLYSIVIDI